MIKIAPQLLFVLLISGCATATRGTHEVVKIESEPPGATILTDIETTNKSLSLDGVYGCRPTPCSLNIPRRSNTVVTASKPGYQPIKFRIVGSVATASSALRTGTVVAGLPPGSYVVSGSPDVLKRIPSGMQVVAGGIMTMGATSVVDVTTGANLNLSPNPVTIVLAPVNSEVGE